MREVGVDRQTDRQDKPDAKNACLNGAYIETIGTLRLSKDDVSSRLKKAK